jgi:hypothetical protein
MHAADRRSPGHPVTLSPCHLVLVAGLGLGLASGPPARAQERPPLRLEGMFPLGVRNSATESWGTFEFSLTNLTDGDRQARVLVFYDGQPDVQYGRDVWVPARARVASWLLVGPAPAQAHADRREIQFLLYDRTDGQERLVAPPGSERVRSRAVLYRKREPFTTMLLDEDPGGPDFGQLPRPASPAAEALDLVRLVRHARELSEHVSAMTTGALPATAEAFDGVDQLVLASARLGDDPPGLRALRRWLERGGTLWVMLDLVPPEALAPLLGDALDFRVVDRVGLTRFRVERFPPAPEVAPARQQEHERSVTFARVLLPQGETARQTVNGWPVWFRRPVGRGEVVFTALGARGWFRPRQRSDRASPYPNFPDLPVAGQELELLVPAMDTALPRDAASAEVLRQPLLDEIGYSVLGRGTVAGVFAGFLVVVGALGLVARRWRRPELLGWLLPAAALLAAGGFVALGIASRRAAVPTLAVTQVADAVAGTDEAPVHGQLAVYRPDSGPADLGVEQGGLMELDMSGLEGQTRRLLLTDLDAWHWDGLNLPAGVRTGSFRSTAATREPLAAVARFGPDGLDGRLTAGPFADPTDALLLTSATGRNLAVRLERGGAFRTGAGDVLPRDQFLTGTVLTDRQQRRQRLYREFLRRSPGRPEAGPVLLAWAEPVPLHVTLGTPTARTVGSALLAVPLRLERPEPGVRITIPGPLVPHERLINGKPTRATPESNAPVDQHLRFRLPPAVLPFRVERARLSAKVNAPSRRVTIAAWTDRGTVELGHYDGPLDPVRLDITDERFLRPDAGGGLHLNVAVSDRPAAEAGNPAGEKWSIEYLELEVTGQAEAEK